MTRVYVITGSASGVGAATTRILRQRGHRVVGIDLRDAEIIADLSKSEDRQRAAKEAIQQSDGVIDAVIACAGISAPIPLTMSVNYFGVVELLEALRPTLAKSPAPRAAVVSSMASLQPHPPELAEAALAGDEAKALEIAKGLLTDDPQSGYPVYPASKRALSRWIRREAVTPEWAGEGIPLNAVAPGVVITPMTEKLLANPEAIAAVDASAPMPLNYHQSAESIGYLLAWLASVDNTHVCGQTIYIDGGCDAVLRGDDIWGAHEREAMMKTRA